VGPAAAVPWSVEAAALATGLADGAGELPLPGGCVHAAIRTRTAKP
jgi:hypothetical protein